MVNIFLRDKNKKKPGDLGLSRNYNVFNFGGTLPSVNSYHTSPRYTIKDTSFLKYHVI